MKNTKKLLLVLALLLAGTMMTMMALQMQQAQLRDKLVRLHVVANSDSAYDQKLKLQVRDAVLAVAQPLLEQAEDPMAVLRQALPQLQAAAEKQLQGTYPVQVTLGREVFPTRVYENFTLPAGVYQSLRVRIGTGMGHNWWCVVFPSICFRATAADLEEAAVAAGFTQAEVRLITRDGTGYELKFKALELLQALKNRLFSTFP